jgi:hypothetical protein
VTAGFLDQPKRRSTLRVRYRETGKTDQVELGDDGQLVGFGDPFGLGDSLEAYTIGPDTFDDWGLIEATDDERRRLRDAGFRIE